MGKIRGAKRTPKRSLPAWVRSLAGGKPTKTVIQEKIECNKCKVVSEGLLWTKTIPVTPNPSERTTGGAIEVRFDGMELSECGHIFLFMVSDDHVYRHNKAMTKLLAELQSYVVAGNTSDAARAEVRCQDLQRKIKSAARRAYREYASLLTVDVIPIDVLTSK